MNAVKNIKLGVISIILIIALCMPLGSIQNVNAQSQGYPVYQVQDNETLNSIGIKFGVSVEDILRINNLPNPDFLSVGTEINIPGLEGVTGKISTITVGIGESLQDISEIYSVPVDFLIKVNRITNPSETYIGAQIIVPIEDRLSASSVFAVNEHSSLIEKSLELGINPWLLTLNPGYFSTSSSILPGRMVHSSLPGFENLHAVDSFVRSLEISPLPLTQGHVAVIKATIDGKPELSGSLNGVPLKFVDAGNGTFLAIQGIHAMAKVGLATFSFEAAHGDNKYTFSQGILISSGMYPLTQTIHVDPATLDDENTEPEDQLIDSVVATASPVRHWTGKFADPMDEPICYSSYFGARRSYNDGPYKYYHTGLDFAVCAPTLEFRAVAPGKVVFAEFTTVRGNATIIDHGWGVYSGYWHQSKLLVNVGDMVETGQVIGEVGSTGRSTGPHLHLEVWAGGVPVDPFDFLDADIPDEVFAKE